MKVRDAMSHEVVTVPEETPFKEVADTLVKRDIGAVPVLDPDGKVCGIITEGDLLAKEAYPGGGKRGIRGFLSDLVSGRDVEWVYKAQGTRAWELMSPNIVSIAPDDELREASRRMLQEGIRHLIVLDGDRLVGIISRSDIMRVLAVDDDELKATIDKYLRLWGYVPPDAFINVHVEKGIVTLEGSVLYESDIRIAGSMVETVDGVVGVENWLLYRFADPRSSSIGVANGNG